MAKIAIVSELFLPNIGGVEVRFRDLGEAFAKIGHDVHIFTIAHKSNLEKFERINNVSIHRIIEDAEYYIPGKKGRKISAIFRFTFALKSHLINFDTVIFGQWPLLPAIFSNWLISGKKSIRCLDYVEHRSGFLFSIIDYLLFSGTQKQSIISDIVFEKIKNRIKQNKAIVVPSSYDGSKYYVKSKQDFLFIGRMEHHKHPEDAIKTVIAYNQKYKTNYKLQMIGDGNLCASLKEKYKADCNIAFHGFISDEDKYAIIAEGKILILPSEREGLPMSIVECMACGIPTLTTDYINNGSKEFVINNKLGIVSKPKIDLLVEGLNEILTRYEYFVANNNNYKHNFDLEANAKKYLKFISQS
ncbi:MAG: glycosyltransferase [Cytophagales bacterium]|nr:MAG: glycosyltransferase [Cytophagales bacterium]